MKSQFETNAVISDLKSVARHSEKLLESIADTADQTTSKARHRLKQTLALAQAAGRNLERKTKRELSKVDDTIWTHPYQSITVAIAVGFAGHSLAES